MHSPVGSGWSPKHASSPYENESTLAMVDIVVVPASLVKVGRVVVVHACAESSVGNVSMVGGSM